jgi:transposase
LVYISKYSINFKTRVVQYHIENVGGARKTAVHVGIDHATVRNWYKAYLLHRVLAFSKRSQTYTVQTWLKRYNEGGADALINRRRGPTMPKKPPRPRQSVPDPERSVAGMTHEEMRQELEYLRAENARDINGEFFDSYKSVERMAAAAYYYSRRRVSGSRSFRPS